jgi:hypothetical protein
LLLIEANAAKQKVLAHGKGELGSFLGYDEDMHELLKYKFLSYKQEMLGDEMVVIPSTSKLTIKEFVEYLEKVERFAVSLGFTLDYHNMVIRRTYELFIGMQWS